jgi:dTDP-4-amino-4,6-dideoxygalactose transaminase
MQRQCTLESGEEPLCFGRVVAFPLQVGDNFTVAGDMVFTEDNRLLSLCQMSRVIRF